ncbi:hypothetical protein SEA_SLEEPYHEAD_26 [Rhodococcus phage Sleepyhead]|uniref:Uncharacterized protein n=1 Tax=Rhodococcus phage Sleepyhead TaxID=2591131 RepID=A0A515MH94_9CAUD|nr:hypothetical protein HWC38_gp26 [Rhodococcus phage Sleepyhead]QDM56041.1 hypothetical protein SEA_SLEEPYHEAD_26 [Rhodococcus phage Sleepyhead]
MPANIWDGSAYRKVKQRAYWTGSEWKYIKSSHIWTGTEWKQVYSTGIQASAYTSGSGRNNWAITLPPAATGDLQIVVGP